LHEFIPDDNLGAKRVCLLFEPSGDIDSVADYRGSAGSRTTAGAWHCCVRD
jgi:hypothetical protein